MDTSWDVIVAGGGPAGLSAALMLGRARRRVLVIDAGSPRNRFAEHMHGVLGHEGASPRALAAAGRAEAGRYGVAFAEGTVESAWRTEGGLRLRTADGEEHEARALIVATGMADEVPDIPGLASRWGRTVLHCPYCHGWEVGDKRLGVIMTSPASMHQAELVRQWSDRVTVFTAGGGEIDAHSRRRLHARGVRLEEREIAEVVGEGDEIGAVRLSDGRLIGLDAIFTAGDPVPHDAFLAPLGLERDDTPFGSFLSVDFAGRTSDERVWAVGNVVNPGANVPKSIGDGSFVGAAVNGALVASDFDAATSAEATWPDIAEAGFWEERYASTERVWSHAANRVLRDVASDLDPARALDVGCGEGADAIWLAQRGWRVVGLDVSETAIARAAEAADREGVSARTEFSVRALEKVEDASFELVTSSFLHSPAELPREDILREAAAKVATGGRLLVTSHAGAPSWADDAGARAHSAHQRFLSPEEELGRLGLASDAWELLIAEIRTREITSPEGDRGTVDDGVLLLCRR